MSIADQVYADFQAQNPEQDFNDELINWREKDDIIGSLRDVFSALQVIQGVQFRGIELITDESKIPRDLLTNDIEFSRLDLVNVHFTLDLQEQKEDITLALFLPKLIDRLFYQLDGSMYFPIFQIVDRGTYITRRTFTLKTLLMPLMFRRDTFTEMECAISGEKITEMVYTLDLFRNNINVLRYFFASKGMEKTFEFLNLEEKDIFIASPKEILEMADKDAFRMYTISGELAVAARKEWIAENPTYRGGMMATIVDAMKGIQMRYIEADEVSQWKRRLGKYFTQNSNGFEEKAEKILISLERILDDRTRKNLAHVADEDKEDVYGILRWMMRDYRELVQTDGMDMRNKRIRMMEYMIHPMLIKFSDSTYRMLNTKNLTFKSLQSMFRQFIYNPEKGEIPQANFLIRRLVNNELLRYSNMVNSFDLLTSLRWTSRGPQSISERGKGDISVRMRGLHPSYIGRVSLVAASAGDPGVSGTLVPFAKTNGQFFV